MAARKKAFKKAAPEKAKPIKEAGAGQDYELNPVEKPKSRKKFWLIAILAAAVIIAIIFTFIAIKNINTERSLPVKEYAKAAIGIACTDKCGDFECDEVVCMADGCPCSENYRTCPNDCHAEGFEKLVKLAKGSECLEKGELKEEYAFNPETRTWWINMKMKPEFEKQGCIPACVIYEDEDKIELNWRCTGLSPE
ncbi:MAG: hypothetical protein QME12_07400 [Nanoarchaeota archaeon]|nr:hypothetical protein [Nanoarchaeota archaeon]